MVFNIVHDMDIVRSKSTRLDQRVPYIEWVGTDVAYLNLLEEKERRVFKSHLPYSLLPEKIKTSPCKVSDLFQIVQMNVRGCIVCNAMCQRVMYEVL